MPALTVAQIAALCGGEIAGAGELLISGANTLQNASSTDLAFAEGPPIFATAAQSRAGCLIVPSNFPALDNQRAIVRVNSPRSSFASVIAALYRKERLAPSIHPTAVVGATTSIGERCSIGAYVTIGENVAIGPDCTVSAGCRIGDRVSIGEGSTLHPNVTIYDAVTIGRRVVLHAGCVLGADGFGFIMAGDHYEKFPQVGTVRLGDDVEIGANSCVDRAALGVTSVGDGSKIDNLVHIAHNCTIGRHVVIAAQAGFSGSVTVGDYAAIGGQAGIGEKAKIDAKAIVGGKSGIITAQHIEAGEPVWGIPARPLRQHLKGLAHVARLQKTLDEIQSVKNRVKSLEVKAEAKSYG